jgi:hypothetical protein
MNTSVYWIRHKDHTDIFSQGYVGVSKNTNIRWKQHFRYGNDHLKNAIKKYGEENIIKEIILISDDKYCLEIEKKLRAKDHIGWNICKGGGMPPSMLGKPNLKNSIRFKGKTGSKCHNLKYYIIAKNIVTGAEKKFVGNAELTNAGFQFQNVNHCLQGKRKTHKGHTFKRIEK